jgi:hypothetical protein
LTVGSVWRRIVAQREEVIERVYYHLNVVRRMGLEFINPDG